MNGTRNNNHAKFTLSEEEMELIKSNVFKSIMAVLPEMLHELNALIIEKQEALISENIAKGLEIFRGNLTNNLNANKEVYSFIYRNNNHWQKKLVKRKDIYCKFTRSDQLILLYNKYLEEELIYYNMVMTILFIPNE